MLKRVFVGCFILASFATAATVQVQSGDTLGEIAVRYNTSIGEIMRLNHLSDQRIRVGQELRLPLSATITVQAGDTLEAIAKRNGTSVEALRRANNLKNDSLRPGQALRLPDGGSSSNSASSTKTISVASSATYTVRSGDTLEGIGKRFGVSVDQLKAWNGLKDDALKLDQVLNTSAPRVKAPSPQASKPVSRSASPVPSVKPSNAKPASTGMVTGTGNTRTVKTVTVKPGDTLSAIAKRGGVSLETLRRLNGLTSDAIKDGQTLKISEIKPVVSSAPKKPAVTKPAVTRISASPSNTKKPNLTVKPNPVKPAVSSQPSVASAKKPAVVIPAKPTPSGSKPVVVTVKPALPADVQPSAPQPMDEGAAAPAPTAPSDVLEDGTDYQIIEPNLPANVNRNEHLLWPLSGVLTSPFGYRWGKLHTGLDIAVPTGTSVYAALSGTVQFAGWNRFGYGYLVVVRGVDGRDYYYGHNSRLLVQRGQFVRQGSQISRSGSTGYSTGPHLHFEIRIGGKPRNPMAYLPSSQVQQARYAGR